VRAAAVVLATFTALVLASASWAGTPPTPLAVHAAFDSPIAGFGDAVTARIDIEIDRSAVESSTLHVTTDFAPLTLLSAATRTRTVSGNLETVSIEQRAACLTAPCLASVLTMHPVRVSVTTRDGGVSVASPSLQLQLRSRVTAKDLAAASPHFVADVSPPRPSYAVAPTTAALLLDAIAALAAASAAALLALQVLGARRRRGQRESGDELAHALRLVREAEHRPVPDRRRALALLARLLRSRDDTLGHEASRLAWSAPAPEPPAIDALVTDVEGERAG
jgi:hypothetical protein